MPNTSFSIGEALRFGWKTLKENVGLFILLFILTVILVSLPALIVFTTGWDRFQGAHIAVGIINHLIGIAILLGYTNVSLRLAKGEKATIGDFFSRLNVYIPFFFGYWLFSIVTFIGLILFVFPAFIWGLRYLFYSFFIVEKGIGPVEAFVESRKITNGMKWDLLGYAFVGVILNLIGILCLIVGIFVTYPIVFVGYAYIYWKLRMRLMPNEKANFPDFERPLQPTILTLEKE